MQNFECLAAFTDKMIIITFKWRHAHRKFLNFNLTYPDATYVYVLLKYTFIANLWVFSRSYRWGNHYCMDDVIRCGVSETSVLTYASVTYVYFFVISHAKLCQFLSFYLLLLMKNHYYNLMTSCGAEASKFLFWRMPVQRAYTSCKSAWFCNFLCV